MEGLIFFASFVGPFLIVLGIRKIFQGIKYRRAVGRRIGVRQ